MVVWRSGTIGEEAGMTERIFLRPGAGETFDLGAVGSGEVKAAADTTDDIFCVWELTLRRGGVPVPPHLHQKLHEFCFVLAGEVKITLDDQRIDAGPGMFCYAPPGTLHSFGHLAGDRARVLIAATPAGVHQAILDAAGHLFVGRPPDAEKMASLFAGLDIAFPQPPLP